MTFVFDLDDTIAETDAFSEAYILEFFKRRGLPYKKVRSVARFAEQKFDWDEDTAVLWYKTHGDDMMRNFPCKNGAIELINSLYKLGHKIVIATARGNDWHKDPVKTTMDWLNKRHVKYSELFIGRVDKEAICEQVDADFFIDDDVEITKRVAEYFKKSGKQGCRTFLISSSYNKHLQPAEGVKRVYGFSDLSQKIAHFQSELE